MLWLFFSYIPFVCLLICLFPLSMPLHEWQGHLIFTVIRNTPLWFKVATSFDLQTCLFSTPYRVCDHFLSFCLICHYASGNDIAHCNAYRHWMSDCQFRLFRVCLCSVPSHSFCWVLFFWDGFCFFRAHIEFYPDCPVLHSSAASCLCGSEFQL